MLADPPTKLLVINEWIFQDIKGENGQLARDETARFLTQFKQGQDKFAVLKVSPWAKKADELMRHGDFRIRTLSKLMRSMIFDLSKCRILQPEDVETAAPQDAIAAAPEEDVYLIQTYYAAGADLLISTDTDLLGAFESCQNVHVMHRDAFLNDYLNS